MPEAGRYLAAAPECLSYELAQCTDNERTFMLRIRWASTEAHLAGFRGGPHFQPFLALIQPFIPEILEMRHYQAVFEVAWCSPLAIEEKGGVPSDLMP